MFELKILRAFATIHRLVLRTTLRSLNLKDKLALKKYNSRLSSASGMRQFADQLVTNAEDTEYNANRDYDKRSRDINSAYNHVHNAIDDLPTYK